MAASGVVLGLIAARTTLRMVVLAYAIRNRKVYYTASRNGALRVQDDAPQFISEVASVLSAAAA
jgi:hypothetical protein